MNEDWKRELAETVKEHKDALKSREKRKAAHQTTLSNFFVQKLNPFLSTFSNEVARHGYSAKPDTTDHSATIKVKGERDADVFSASFKGEVTSEGMKIVATNSHKEAETIFDGTDIAGFDEQVIFSYLIRQLREAKDKPVKKSIQVF